MAFCSKCGAQINEGAQFCPKCGQLVAGTTPEQQVNYSQQQYVAQSSEEQESWISKVWHSKWSWIVAIVFFIFLVAVNSGGSKSNIEKTTKEIMVDKFKKEGVNLDVKSLNLVHKSGNEYTGLAECKVDGEDVQFSLKVISDGETVQAEWELSDIGSRVFEEEDDDSNVSESDIAQAGYEAGYEMGFDMADIDIDPDAKQSFSLFYGAPSTPEEKEMYNVYKHNYERGYREGKRAGRE